LTQVAKSLPIKLKFLSSTPVMSCFKKIKQTVETVSGIEEGGMKEQYRV
jgi:hypothetical protein